VPGRRSPQARRQRETPAFANAKLARAVPAKRQAP
jgi:hypothetical protein